MNKFSFSVGSIILLSLVLQERAWSATIRVKNDNNESLELVIEPGEGTVLPNRQQTNRVIKKHQTKSFTVTEVDFPNNSTFSVLGKVAVPSLYNRCTGLFLSKDYEITFSPTPAGATSCHVTEVMSKKD
jgi:hypothetical protein